MFLLYAMSRGVTTTGRAMLRAAPRSPPTSAMPSEPASGKLAFVGPAAARLDAAARSNLRNEIPMTDCDLDTSVPDWIIDHPETLRVFQALGIDYSCGGKSLEYACREQRLDGKMVLGQLLQTINDCPKNRQA